MSALLQDWFTRQVQRRPEAAALIMLNEQPTYSQLEEATNQLARLLQAMGCQRGGRVCLLLPKSPSAIVGILGILKADGIYVPLDPSSPAPRLTYMIASCEPRCILAAGAMAPLVDELFAAQVGVTETAIGWLDAAEMVGRRFRHQFFVADRASFASLPLTYQNTDQDPAYILFTSGSTGIPKGVVITHANVIHFVEWATRYFGLGPSDRLSGHPPLHLRQSRPASLAGGISTPCNSNLSGHLISRWWRTGWLSQRFTSGMTSATASKS